MYAVGSEQASLHSFQAFWSRITILFRTKHEVAKITFPSPIPQYIHKKQMNYVLEIQELSIQTIPALYIYPDIKLIDSQKASSIED